MARKPAKPWYRKSSNAWFICIDGKQINLGPEKKAAQRRFHEIMAQEQLPEPPPPAQTAVFLIDIFLEWTKQHRAPETYDWYQKRLQSFIHSLPDKEMATDQLRPFHVQQWVDAHDSWGDTYKHGAIIAVQRVFNWAEKLGHIERSPIPYIEKPKASRRDNHVTAEVYEEILSHVKDKQFRPCWSSPGKAAAAPKNRPPSRPGISIPSANASRFRRKKPKARRVGG